MTATMILLIGLGLQAAHDRAERPRLPADVGAGRVAWFDLTTTNLQQSTEFYGKLFDWRFTAVQGSDRAVEIVSGTESIGTLRTADGKISPFNGVIYVQVADVRASCQRATELGGTVAPGFPFDLPDGRGAVGLVLDPAGHPIGVYSRTPLPATGAPK